MAFIATQVTVNGTTPVLIVPGSPVGKNGRRAVIQNSSVVGSLAQLYLGGSTFVGSAGFPLSGTAVFSVEARRQQDLYAAAAINNANNVLTILMDAV